MCEEKGMYSNVNISSRSLVTAPVIPSSVVNMDVAFAGCDSLAGTIEIPCTCEGQNIGYSNITVKHFEGCGH